MKGRLAAGLAIAAAVVGSIWWWQSPTRSSSLTLPPAEQSSPQDAAESGGGDPTAIGVRRAPQQPSNPVAETAPIAPPRVFEPVHESIQNAKSAATHWNFQTYHERVDQSDSIDGELAMEAYYFVKSCIGKPRTVESMSLRLDQVERLYHDESTSNDPDRYATILDRMQDEFERCLGLDDFDLVATAVDWLQIAAEADHLPAQLYFYAEIPDLMRKTQDRIYREPHYLDLHRQKSSEYLHRALESGHPDAFRIMASAIVDGVLYESDPVLAAAYLEAAARSDQSENLTTAMGLDHTMTPTDRRLSSELADGICMQYGC